MKKPIGKRIAGFLAAAALAVTSVTGSFTDVLKAKAAVTWRNVLVTVYDENGEAALDNSKIQSRYYVLGMLSNECVHHAAGRES